MLKRLYLNNYKACVNFEIEFDSINLIMGQNGSGKSTLFEALRSIQILLIEPRPKLPNSVAILFPPETLTFWYTGVDGQFQQTFELDIQSDGGIYKYQLIVEHDPSLATQDKTSTKIHSERLEFNGQKLLESERGEAQLYKDDGSEGSIAMFGESYSAISTIRQETGNKQLLSFRSQLEKLIVVHPVPPMMSGATKGGKSIIDFHARDFAAWYRTISNDQGLSRKIQNKLANIFDDFDSLVFTQVGQDSYRLDMRFGDNGQYTHQFKNHLSDGQKMLLVLYTFLEYARRYGEFTLCIDEPENFVSLTEIQPWIDEVYDDCVDEQMQAIIISHHPSYIDNLAAAVGLYFTKDGVDKPVRIKQLDTENVLPISVLMQRGRLDE